MTRPGDALAQAGEDETQAELEDRFAFFHDAVSDWLADPGITIVCGRWSEGAISELMPGGTAALLPPAYEGRFAGIRELRIRQQRHHLHIDFGRIHALSYVVAPSVCLGFDPSLEIRLLATDEAGIQFRILNSSKGPAVRATRAQADRVLYKAAIRRRLENQPNLWLFQQAVDDLTVVGDRVTGVVTQIGLRFEAPAVVLTAGTFLNGLVHVGLQNYSAGRAGDPPAISLGARLKLAVPQTSGQSPRLATKCYGVTVTIRPCRILRP